MRTLFNIGIIAVIVTTFWFGGHTVAGQKNVAAPVDPFNLTVSTTNVSAAPQYDLY